MPETHDAFGMLLQRQNELFSEMKEQESALRKIQDTVSRIDERLTDYAELKQRVAALEKVHAKALGWAMAAALFVSLAVRFIPDWIKTMVQP